MALTSSAIEVTGACRSAVHSLKRVPGMPCASGEHGRSIQQKRDMICIEEFVLVASGNGGGSSSAYGTRLWGSALCALAGCASAGSAVLAPSPSLSNSGDKGSCSGGWAGPAAGGGCCAGGGSCPRQGQWPRHASKRASRAYPTFGLRREVDLPQHER